jgi:protein FAM50
MDKFAAANDDSRSGTPSNARFTTQAATAEDILKSQTVGLVHLDDFRKRRAEALDLKERGGSGASTPQGGYVCTLPSW